MIRRIAGEYGGGVVGRNGLTLNLGVSCGINQRPSVKHWICFCLAPSQKPNDMLRFCADGVKTMRNTCVLGDPCGSVARGAPTKSPSFFVGPGGVLSNAPIWEAVAPDVHRIVGLPLPRWRPRWRPRGPKWVRVKTPPPRAHEK